VQLTQFQALPVITEARQWLHLTGKCSIVTLGLGGTVFELQNHDTEEEKQDKHHKLFTEQNG